MQEAETADGIEFVGEDVSGVDLGEDDNGRHRVRGRDISDGDEDEEELEEIVVEKITKKKLKQIKKDKQRCIR